MSPTRYEKEDVGEPPTSKLTLTLTKGLIKRIKSESRNKFGRRKGAISMWVEMVLRNELSLELEGVDER